jgi:hypothetical protein
MLQQNSKTWCVLAACIPPPPPQPRHPPHPARPRCETPKANGPLWAAPLSNTFGSPTFSSMWIMAMNVVYAIFGIVFISLSSWGIQMQKNAQLSGERGA